LPKHSESCTQKIYKILLKKIAKIFVGVWFQLSKIVVITAWTPGNNFWVVNFYPGANIVIIMYIRASPLTVCYSSSDLQTQNDK
jgi:hypothetical protein